MRDSESDAMLMRAAVRDAAAFTVIYRRHASVVYAVAARRVGSDLAEEVTAEVFARAWLHRRKFRDNRDGSARPWLLGIARNVTRDLERTRRVDHTARRRLGLPIEGVNEMEDAVAERIDAAAAASGLLGSLTDAERAAVQLRVMDGLPFDEVARRLGLRGPAARLRVSRALRKLASVRSDAE